MLYSSIWICDSRISGQQVDDQWGITVSNVADASSVVIEHSTISCVGQEFGAIAAYWGRVRILPESISGVDGPAVVVNGASLSVARKA